MQQYVEQCRGCTCEADRGRGAQSTEEEGIVEDAEYTTVAHRG
jgi:hypothetical protein